ncbi:hypothetical protein NSS90_14905 [Bacillus sp. PS93]|uniref:hypothetical protein n=1 Tax=unclassified Bacillus (in: firmicutes) TaxID=185979 RepID=UPI0030CCF381
MAFSEELKRKIQKSIQEKGALRPCDKCGCQDIILLDQYVRVDMQDSPYDTVLGGHHIPAIGLVCDRCGNINLFAAKSIIPSEI